MNTLSTYLLMLIALLLSLGTAWAMVYKRETEEYLRSVREVYLIMLEDLDRAASRLQAFAEEEHRTVESLAADAPPHWRARLRGAEVWRNDEVLRLAREIRTDIEAYGENREALTKKLGENP